ncbi:MAG: phospho-sugar mutase [Solobacterium sp.]|nr:phospho-sugar mutase [Solobacterium sp.]
MTRWMDEYNRWCEQVFCDEDINVQLNEMAGNETAIEDAFYRDLAFGTGGLRGVIGAGTNRMNVCTVGKASQGLADYVNKHFPEGKRSIAVSYDSRIKSDLFARTASAVFAANGIHVYLYSQLMPTPCLSYAVRYLGASAGIMVTASHNPAKYNGYKVYGSDGCQITTEAAKEILGEIEKLDCFKDVKTISFEEGLSSGLIEYISEDVYTSFTECVKHESVLGDNDEIDRNVAIVYSPLNGTGLKPVTRALKEAGFTNITVVREQEQPDGNFPTCPYPNPEIREAMELGMEYCRKYNADLLLATDPDCDRCGIAVRCGDDYQLLTGNEVGLLLLDYICSQRIKNKTMPEHPVFVKTIVTMDLAERIAEHYGVETVNVLTGFKFIGEVIGRLEAQGRQSDYICGFEESYGYLTGTYVRDKDAVNAAYMICEMFAYYRTRSISLLEKLNEIYQTYGYCLNTLHSYEFEGSAGFARMQEIMKNFRMDMTHIAGRRIQNTFDYLEGLNGLPKSDVLKFILKDHCSVVVRPSGTEPKLKTYISVSAPTREQAAIVEQDITEYLNGYFK